MTRIDQHIRTVRNKPALGRLVEALGWAVLVLVGVAEREIMVASPAKRRHGRGRCSPDMKKI